jgi:hypothetical protein
LAGATVVETVNVSKIGLFIALSVDHNYAVFAFGYGLANLDVL